MSHEDLQITQGRSNITLTDKVMHGVSKKKKYFFMANYHEFTFPLRQISSIRYVKERNLSIRGGIFAIIFIFTGIHFISSFGFIGLLAGGLILWNMIMPKSMIRITTSGADRIDYEIKQSNIENANKFITEANERIASI